MNDNAFDEDGLLAALNNMADYAARPQVSDDDVRRKAEDMARCGYRFNAQTLGLVRKYLEGGGLMLGGNVGTGKTFFFQTAGVEAAVNLKIAQGWDLREIGDALDSFRETELLIDDVGVEELDYKSYGTQTRLLDFILEYRMDAGAATHFTTNLTPQQLLDRYGERVVDRMTQLAKYIKLDGASRRCATAIRPDTRLFTEFIKGKVWWECAARCKFYDEESHRCLKGMEYEPRSVDRCDYF